MGIFGRRNNKQDDDEFDVEACCGPNAIEQGEQEMQRRGWRRDDHFTIDIEYQDGSSSHHEVNKPKRWWQ